MGPLGTTDYHCFSRSSIDFHSQYLAFDSQNLWPLKREEKVYSVFKILKRIILFSDFHLNVLDQKVRLLFSVDES